MVERILERETLYLAFNSITIVLGVAYVVSSGALVVTGKVALFSSGCGEVV